MSADISFKLGHQEEILDGSVTSTVRAVFAEKHRRQVGDRTRVLAGKRGDLVERPVLITEVIDTKLQDLTEADLRGGSCLAPTPRAVKAMLENAHERILTPRQAVQVVRFEYLD